MPNTKLKQILLDEDITQLVLCQTIADMELKEMRPGISAPSMCAIVNGKIKNPTRQTMMKIVKGLNECIKSNKYTLNDLFY